MAGVPMLGGLTRRVAAALALACATLLAAPDLGRGLPVPTSPVGRFVTLCEFSHGLPDDPIVSPGVSGGAHLHQFFGSRHTDAFSTARGLRRTPGTTCNLRRDRSGYWIPALFIDERVVRPEKMFAYYSSRGREPATIRPMPRGLEMIAGDAGSLSRQHPGITQWACVPRRGALPSPVPIAYPVDYPDCRADETLALSVFFPDCWDGRRLDSPDHQSHMAYSEERRGAYQHCPASHPVPVPGLGLRFHYRSNGSASGVELSSGGVNSAHADFLNGWVHKKMRRLVRTCIREARDCAHFGA
jgi:hypothetical protein